MSYLCDLFSFLSWFSLWIIACFLLFLDDNVDEECEQFSNSKSSASGCCLAFAWFFGQFQPDIGYKSVAY